jgi:hypothetical protein
MSPQYLHNSFLVPSLSLWPLQKVRGPKLDPKAFFCPTCCYPHSHGRRISSQPQAARPPLGVNHAECALPHVAFPLQHPFSKLCKSLPLSAAHDTDVFLCPYCTSCSRDATQARSLCLGNSSHCTHPHSSSCN